MIDGAKSKLEGLSSGLKSAGKGVTAMTAPIAGFGAAAVFTAANFEQAMAKVGAVSGANDAQLASLTSTAEQLGRTTSFSASQAAEGMQFLAMAGFEVNDIISAMPGMLSAAAASGADLGTTADIVSNVLTGFALSADDATMVADTLVGTLTTSNTDLEQLGNAFSYVAPSAQALGVPLTEAAAAIGFMSNAGVQGSKAGTGLRKMLLNLSAPTEAAAAKMEALGINVWDAQGKFKGLPEIVGEFEDAFAGLTDAERSEALDQIVGTIGAPAFLALMSQGSDALAEYTLELEGMGGVAEEVATKQLDTFNGKLTILKSALEGLFITVGNTILPILTQLAEAFAPIVSSITTAFEKLEPSTQKLIVGVAAIAVAIGPILWGLGVFIGQVKNLTVVFGPLLAALNPVTLAIAGIVAAVGALIYFDVGGIQTKLKGMLDAITPVVTTIKEEFEGVKRAFDALFSGDLDFGQFIEALKLAIGQIDFTAIRQSIVAALGIENIEIDPAAMLASLQSSISNAVANFDAAGMVKGMADKLSEGISGIDWTVIGQKFREGVKTAFALFFLPAVIANKVATGLVTGIGANLESLDWMTVTTSINRLKTTLTIAFQEFIQGFTGEDFTFGELIAKVVAGFQTGITGAGEGLANFTTAIGEWWNGIDWATALASMVTNIATAISEIEWTVIGTNIKIAVEALVASTVAAAIAGGLALFKLTDGFLNVTTAFASAVEEIFTSESVKTAFGGLATAISDMMAGLISGFTDGDGIINWPDLTQAIKDAILGEGWEAFPGWDELITWPTITAPNWGSFIKFPTAAQFLSAFRSAVSRWNPFAKNETGNAVGAQYTSDRPRLVGEFGPELLVPPRGAAILRQDTTNQVFGAALSGGNASPTINIYQQPGQDASALAREVAAVLERRRR